MSAANLATAATTHGGVMAQAYDPRYTADWAGEVEKDNDRSPLGRGGSRAPGGEQTRLRGEPAAIRCPSHPAVYIGPLCVVRVGFMAAGPPTVLVAGTSNGAEPAAALTPLWRGGHRKAVRRSMICF
jgi:hypothetical protein